MAYSLPYLPYPASFAHTIYRVFLLYYWLRVCYSMCNSVLLFVSHCFASSWPGCSCKWEQGSKLLQEEICLLKLSIIVDLSVVTVCPSLSAVGSWEEVLLFSMDFSVPKLLQDANLKKVALAFLTDCVYCSLTTLKGCLSRGLLYASAVRHRMFLCWSRVVKSGVNEGLYLFLVLHFFEWGMFI